MSKKIFSYQDYTSFSFYHPTSLSLDFNLRSTLDFKLKDSKIPFINLDNFKKEVVLKSSVFKMLGDNITFEDEYKQIKQIYDFFMHGHIKLSEEFLKVLNIDWNLLDVQKKKTVFDFQKTCNSFAPRTINDWKVFLQLAKDNKCYFLEYDYHPFKVQEYQNFKKEDLKIPESEKIKTFLKDLQDAGFKFRKKDLDGWKEFLEDYD